MKKYIEPKITIIETEVTSLLSGSNSQRLICTDYCKLWHICRDRSEGKFCSDKKY